MGEETYLTSSRKTLDDFLQIFLEEKFQGALFYAHFGYKYAGQTEEAPENLNKNLSRVWLQLHQPAPYMEYLDVNGGLLVNNKEVFNDLREQYKMITNAKYVLTKAHWDIYTEGKKLHIEMRYGRKEDDNQVKLSYIDEQSPGEKNAGINIKEYLEKNFTRLEKVMI